MSEIMDSGITHKVFTDRIEVHRGNRIYVYRPVEEYLVDKNGKRWHICLAAALSDAERQELFAG